MEENNRRPLYKNPDKAKLCGVCAGIAEYFGFEVWVVRVISVSLLLLGIFNGFIALAYIVLCFVLDPKPGSVSNKGCFGRDKKRSNYRSTEEESNKPYRSSVKDVWKSGASPRETLETIEDKFSKLEKKLQSMESFVTTNDYQLEKEFRDMEK